MSQTTVSSLHPVASHIDEAIRPSWLTTTVPREFVHRAAVAEVLLTGWRRRSERTFRVRAQWPRGHSYFTPLSGARHDPMLAAETIRQTGALLAHAEFDVPLGHHFLMWDLNLTADAEQLAVGAAPADLDLDITCTEIGRRAGRLSALHYEAVLHRGGATVATGSARFTCTTPEVYRRLRGARASAVPSAVPAEPVPAPNVGRIRPCDVVLGPAPDPGAWLLRFDPLHPVLFDHPGDHVPGMVLLEAARQAAFATLSSPDFVPVAVASTFHRYVEFDQPCRIEAERLPAEHPGTGRVRVRGRQDGREVLDVTITALV
ncbi:ScbA/BarX family gamma-butyrolactone biosynthesis protein [Kitasatospora cinereorecta]|uniref:ScbA/BarX family gamma-butyrolactone biosynthesis protein n=1 Tax=Kitasatospora cinereorecta TaxID=285560 RepID=A0ABW0VJH3_9ACTN